MAEAKGSGTGTHGIVGEMLCVDGGVAGEDWGLRREARRWWVPLGQQQRRPGFQVMKSGLGWRGDSSKDKIRLMTNRKLDWTARRRCILGGWSRFGCDLGERRHTVRGLRLAIKRDVRCGVRNSRRKVGLRFVMALLLDVSLDPRNCRSRIVRFSRQKWRRHRPHLMRQRPGPTRSLWAHLQQRQRAWLQCG